MHARVEALPVVTGVVRNGFDTASLPQPSQLFQLPHIRHGTIPHQTRLRRMARLP